MSDKWQAMQAEIGAFTDKTFGESTVQAKMQHLMEEIEEVKADPEDRFEWADCLILLMDGARKAGFTMDDLHQAVTDKMEINKARNWGEPDEHGVVKHVG